MSYINLRLTQGQAEFLKDRLSADKASYTKEAEIAAMMGDAKLSLFHKEQVKKLNTIINDLYLELNEQKESYNGR